MKHPKAIYDMHCHLGFMRNDLSQDAIPNEAYFLSMTVDPNTFISEVSKFRDFPNVKVGAGLHPRWISEGIYNKNDVELLLELIENTALIGEIGLDYLPQYQESKSEQLNAFSNIALKCACEKDKILSIHALRSNDDVLDIIEKYKLTNENICILHWFNGNNDQLIRAINLGCYFSLNSKFMQTKRAPHYARRIPTNRILLETDLPSNKDGAETIGTLRDSLQEAENLLENAIGKHIADEILSNSQRIFNLC